MSHTMRGDRRPVSQLHSADDVPELMRRAMRSLVRAEALAKDLANISDVDRGALHAGFLGLVRRYVVQLREEGETPARVADRLREDLDDSLVPLSVAHHCAALIDEAEQCIADVFAPTVTRSHGWAH
jgi:hypothetical protein